MMAIESEIRSVDDRWPPVGSIEWWASIDLSGLIIYSDVATNGFGGAGPITVSRLAPSPVDRTMDFAIAKYESLLRRLAD